MQSSRNHSIKLTTEVQERLNQAIEAKKTTKYKIAKYLGYSPSTLTNYCEGRVDNPDLGKLTAICKYLGISLHWLETGENCVVEKGDTDAQSPETNSSLEEKINLLLLKFDTRDHQYQNLHTDLEIVRNGMNNLFSEVKGLSADINSLRTKVNNLPKEIKKKLDKDKEQE